MDKHTDAATSDKIHADEDRRRWAIDLAIHARTYEDNYVKIVDLAKEIENYVKGRSDDADFQIYDPNIDAMRPLNQMDLDWLTAQSAWSAWFITAAKQDAASGSITPACLNALQKYEAA